ncbi:MAG TPA: SusC/RagA family TonB-linked outer membrane protein [Hanamia sp.]
MKLIIGVMAILLPLLSVTAQEIPPGKMISGKILSASTGLPVAGATLTLLHQGTTVSTNASGIFSIPLASSNDDLTVSHIGFLSIKIGVSNNTSSHLVITLQDTAIKLDEAVVNTGYQSIPKERATGSFVHIDNALINRSVSTNILDRLQGVTSGLIFNAGSINAGTRLANEQTGITIRGRSTIDEKISADPLIVLDNFPYEGDINNINPDDIESITILKDAAAASIWGARAANGVIVLTTKKGKLSLRPKVLLNSSITFSRKPDLSYSKNFLSAPGFIDVETFLFNKGYFDADINNLDEKPMLSPVVEILLKQQSGSLSAAETQAQLNILRQQDVRHDFLQYVYRPALQSKLSINIRGGSANASWSLTAGYDKNLDVLVRNDYSRFTINSINSFIPVKNLEFTAAIIYSGSIKYDNTSTSAYGSIHAGSKYGNLYPYAKLADDQGNPLAITNRYRAGYIDSISNVAGFLDWHYRPLDEIRFADNSSGINSLILRGEIKYRFSSSLDASVQYQRQAQTTSNSNLQDINTYTARNWINLFYNAANGTYPLPKGGYLVLYNEALSANNFRAQVNYNQSFHSMHTINAIAGAELREINTSAIARNSFGYDPATGSSVDNLNYEDYFPLNPSGYNYASIPSPFGGVLETTNRFISYFANAGYTYREKYTATFSGRKDGANLFGVKTNDKITPLWSAGLGWHISKENFYRLPWLPYLKLRASYGANGNVYNANAYLTAKYATSSLTGLPYAVITSPPNPELRWEKVRNLNLGIDFRSKQAVISGSIEMFRKDGVDLITSALLAPSTGFSSFKGNAAGMITKGIDLTLNTRNIRGIIEWNTTFLLSHTQEKITRIDQVFDAKALTGNGFFGSPEFAGLLPVVGKPLFGIYSYRWGGLDKNGNPLGYLDDTLSTNYQGIVSRASLDNLVFNGSSRPLWFGSLRNTVSWKGLSFSANITFKLGYYFRRSSVSLNYADNIQGNTVHSDYYQRWQQVGDENHTNIPALVYPSDDNRNNFYKGSSVLIEKGDHIRLQDISLQYTFGKQNFNKLPFEQVQLYMYINNLGILWRANKQGIDPDFNDNGYGSRMIPAAKTISLGLKLSF